MLTNQNTAYSRNQTKHNSVFSYETVQIRTCAERGERSLENGFELSFFRLCLLCVCGSCCCLFFIVLFIVMYVCVFLNFGFYVYLSFVVLLISFGLLLLLYLCVHQLLRCFCVDVLLYVCISLCSQCRYVFMPLCLSLFLS